MSKQSDLVNITQGDADINGGTIDGTVIGGSTPAAISGTTGTFSGNLSVGTTGVDPHNPSEDAGVALRSDGRVHIGVDGDTPLHVNRNTNDGDIIRFRKDGSTFGAIGNPYSSTRMSIYGDNGSTGAGLYFGNSEVLPTDRSGNIIDNVNDFGGAGHRWDDIYATNGTIQTSDRNEKQDIEALSDAEQRVAVATKGLLRKYRWKDAVAEKGDAARIHFGIIAQDLQAAFEAEGLDAGRYGMFISSTWWEAEVEKPREVEQEDGTTITETYTATETYDEPTEGATERTRLGVRYPELLAFIIAAL